MKTIRFIRHAESAVNAGLPTTDPGGIPLTENGKQAAALAVAEYDGPEPDLIVVSPCHGIFMNAAAFCQAPEEEPSDLDSMRRFQQYTLDHPVPNLGIWGYPNPSKRLAKLAGEMSDEN